MRCPACGCKLIELRTGETTVDVCAEGCGGIWFDPFEMDRLTKPHENPALLLCMEQIEAPPGVNTPRSCPRCPEIFLSRRYSSLLKRVELDECPNCGGTWLDFGELARIREENNALAPDREAAEASFARQFQGLLDVGLVARVNQAERMGGPLRVLDFIDLWREGDGDSYSHFQAYYDSIRQRIRKKDGSGS